MGESGKSSHRLVSGEEHGILGQYRAQRTHPIPGIDDGERLKARSRPDVGIIGHPVDPTL